MNAERLIELSQPYPCVVSTDLIVPEEPRIVIAGSQITEPLVTSEWGEEITEIIANLTVRWYYHQQGHCWKDQDQAVPTGKTEGIARPIVIKSGNGLISPFVDIDTAKWFSISNASGGTNGSVAQDAALKSLMAVRSAIMAMRGIALSSRDKSDNIEGSAVGFQRIDAGDEEPLLFPTMIVNSLGCSCIGVEGGRLDPLDIETEKIEGAGVTLAQHNVDSWIDSLPILAALGAINSCILEDIN